MVEQRKRKGFVGDLASFVGCGVKTGVWGLGVLGLEYLSNNYLGTDMLRRA